ncbi:MAG: diguanylate cyclase [Pseudolysinimonas sp.]|uniref:bifunctional diguanylate cyclase/phosphodiesterase n=1 Tax=Pseudolysinimonas sp. TaxID=2680009 RepID=UPI003265B5D4
MDPAELATDAAEIARLVECAKELIRTPGAIQSHGSLLAIDVETSTVVVASENAASWLGRTLDQPGSEALAEIVASGSYVDPVRLDWEGVESDAIVHRVDRLVVVEFEPAIAGHEYARTSVVSAIQRLSAITDIGELRRTATASIREITGFDRVTMYHFHSDGHGEIVAEDRHPDLEPYLGLHFPASDIPTQARELYASKLCRAIVSTTEPVIPLVSLGGDKRVLDLSNAELRSISPYHVAYMRNMGQASTVTWSILDHGRLIGMITCAHRTPRRLPVLMRRAIEVLAGQVGLQLSAMTEIAQLRHTIEIRERRAALLAPLYASDDIATALLGGVRTVLDLVPADGVLVSLAGETRSAGVVPPLDGVERALAIMGEGVFTTECVTAEHPELASLLPGVAGLLAVPLGADGSHLLFFRGEEAREVSWLGDPGAANRADQFSPRASFASWKQSVRDRCQPWGTLREEATELGSDLEDALKRRAEARLAELAMRDALTGLYNRRYLLQRLESSPPPGSDDTAMLFIDLDDFKLINDVHGHDVGDGVILEIARRLLANSRPQDIIVRLGGDEFVVLCDGVTRDRAQALAERLVRAISMPVLVGAIVVEITGSCGVVVAGDDSPRENLIEAADAAMYRAKRAGRNRVSS